MKRYIKYVLIVCLLIFSPTLQSADDITYITNDIRIAYVYEDLETIDWPTLYYLNDTYGCRIDLVTVDQRSDRSLTTVKIENRQIYSHTLYLPYEQAETKPINIAYLFPERLPDIVILDNVGKKPLAKFLAGQLTNKTPENDRIFNILKVYRRMTADEKRSNSRDVVLNSREMYNRLADRMMLELPDINVDPAGIEKKVSHLSRYELIKDYMREKAYENNFISGLTTFRISEILDSMLTDSPMKSTMLQQAERVKGYFSSATLSTGRTKVDMVVKGYRELRLMNQHNRIQSEYPLFQRYLTDLLYRSETAALKMVGLSWNGKVILRDSPHGPRLKFLVSLSVDGPLDIQLQNFRFHPYWSQTIIPVDTVTLTIAPHQTFIREYMVDIERKYLEGTIPDSLLFTVDVLYGRIPMTFSSALPVWEAPQLEVTLEPNFYFIKPFPELDIDRVVSHLNVKVAINKPKDFQGEVTIDFETPRGMFAGTYNKILSMPKGISNKTLRIPFTISNLFELGTQNYSVRLSMDNKLVAADTGRIRIASCNIAETRQVGFLPDDNGLLEDVLSMTDAAYRPLTDRSLERADLEAYDVIVIGNNAFRRYQSFTKLKDRFLEYLQQGGSVIVFAQDEDWPGEILPVSLVPVVEAVDKDDITNRIPEARILSKPYPISEKNLLSFFYKKLEIQPAVITPSERVFVTPTGATLLSVSRIGDGQIIYCGLPLTAMINKLDIDAIHLFANILNY